jgi:O-antigen ligase
MLLAAGAYVPLSSATRLGLNPTVQQALAPSYAMAGNDLAPLALEANRGLGELGLTLALVVCLLALALQVRDGRRGARMAWIALGSGLGLFAVAIAHRALDAAGIWGSSVPAFAREPFFGTLVNPNHGGLFCAALVPLALAVGLRRHGGPRVGGLVVAAFMVLGTVFAQSRGALLAMAVGLLVGGALMDRRVAVGGLVALAAATLGLLLVGPTEGLVALSELVVPEALSSGQDLVTGRGDVLRDAARLVQDAPLLGVGGAGFDDAFQLVKRSPAFSTTDHAHMELLQISVEHGWPAAAAWVLGAGAIGLRALRVAPGLSHRRRLLLAGFGGCAAALACSTLFTFPLRIGALQMLGVVSVGCVLGVSDVSSRRTAGRPFAALLPSLAVVALVAFTRLAPSESRWGPADVKIEEAIAALDSQQPEVAEQALLVALARRPADRHALQLMTRVQVQLGDVDGAFQAAGVATEVYPSLPWVWRDLARLQRRVGDFTESRDTWRRVLECDVPEAEREQTVREALRGPGDPVLIAEQVLPDKADVLVIGGRQLEAHSLEAAEERLARAAALDARYGAQYGAFLLRQARPEEALAAVVDLQSCFGLEVRGQALVKLDRASEALSVFSGAVGRCDEPAQNQRLRVGLARARIDTGDDKGVDALEVMLKADPDDVQVLRLLARDARSHGKRSKLTDYLNRLADAGRATPQELKELERLNAGLPIER